MRHGIKNKINFKHTSHTYYVTHTIYMLQIKIKSRLKFFNLQYPSQIVETDTISWIFSKLSYILTLIVLLFSLKCAPLLPQCWIMHILEHWDDGNTQINIGEEEMLTSVLRFLMSTVGSFSISRPWDKEGAPVPPPNFSAIWASVWSKNNGPSLSPVSAPVLSKWHIYEVM